MIFYLIFGFVPLDYLQYMFWVLDFIFLLSRESGSESLYIGFFNKIMLSLVTAHWLGQLGEGETKEEWSQENNLKVSYKISFSSCELKVPSSMGWKINCSLCFWLLAIMLCQINLILRMEQVNKHVKRPVQYLNPSIVECRLAYMIELSICSWAQNF